METHFLFQPYRDRVSILFEQDKGRDSILFEQYRHRCSIIFEREIRERSRFIWFYLSYLILFEQYRGRG